MAGKNKIMQAVVSFAGTIDPSLGKAMDNVAGHLDKVNWRPLPSVLPWAASLWRRARRSSRPGSIWQSWATTTTKP